MKPEFTIEVTDQGWRLEHSAWGGQTVFLTRVEGIFQIGPEPKPVVMVTPSAFVVSGEYRA